MSDTLQEIGFVKNRSIELTENFVAHCGKNFIFRLFSQQDFPSYYTALTNVSQTFKNVGNKLGNLFDMTIVF